MGVPNSPTNSGAVQSIAGGAVPQAQPTSVNSSWLTTLLTGALGGSSQQQTNAPVAMASGANSKAAGSNPNAGSPGPTPATQDIGQSKVAANSYLGGGSIT